MAKKKIRKTAALLSTLCGVVVGIGGLVASMGAGGPRPETWMAHTLFSKVLVYSYVYEPSFWKSAGLEVLIMGVLMIIGALIGRKLLVIVAALVAAAVVIMWTGLVAHTFNAPYLPNSHELNPANLPWADLRAGAWMVLGGAVLGSISSLYVRRTVAD